MELEQPCLLPAYYERRPTKWCSPDDRMRYAQRQSWHPNQRRNRTDRTDLRDRPFWRASINRRLGRRRPSRVSLPGETKAWWKAEAVEEREGFPRFDEKRWEVKNCHRATMNRYYSIIMIVKYCAPMDRCLGLWAEETWGGLSSASVNYVDTLTSYACISNVVFIDKRLFLPFLFFSFLFFMMTGDY